MSLSLPEDVLAEYKEAFSMFDIDGDGTIDATELDNVMKDLGTPATAKELQELLTAVDADGNGVIDFEEFCAMMATRGTGTNASLSVEEEARNVFRALDKDGDGIIGLSDLQSACDVVRWGVERPPNAQDLQLMMAIGGDPIDFSAFLSIVKRIKSS